MLGLDEDFNKLLNIKESTFDDKPEDFYTVIVNLINGYLINNLETEKDKTNPDFKLIEAYERLLKLELFRDVIKKCIMTIPYNATAIQGIKYLRESFIIDDIIYKDDLDNIISKEDIKTKNKDDVIKQEF
jgi:hypothetical protein